MADLMYDEFKLFKKVQLNNEDISSLTLLYLPLIGLDSYSIYLVMSSLEISVSYNFKRLLDITSLKSMKSLTSSIDKLEAIGLINTYKSNDNSYLFVMNYPLKTSDFLKEEVLVTLLESQIGKEEILKIKKTVSREIKGYQNVTKSFDQVFTTSTISYVNTLNDILKPSITLINEDFNYLLFKMLFDSTFIDEEVLNEQEFKNTILKVSFVYKLNEEDMKEAVIKTIEKDKRFDYPTLSKNARNIFQTKYKVDTPRLVTKGEDEFLSSSMDDATIALCNQLENLSPTACLMSMGGKKASVSELKIFEDLINNTSLSKGAINFMFLMVNNEKGGELPGYNYFEKIANTWARANVKNAMDAIKYIEGKKKNDVKRQEKYSSKKKASVPSWYKDYEKELEDKVKSDSKEIDTSFDAKKIFED